MTARAMRLRLQSKQCHNLKGDRVMSRYRIAEAPNEVVVGWDPPLQTYFLEVFKAALGGEEEEEDEILLWPGTRPGEIPTVAAIEDVLAAHAELTSGAALTPELCRKLEEDQANSTLPSELQRHMIELLGLK